MDTKVRVRRVGLVAAALVALLCVVVLRSWIASPPVPASESAVSQPSARPEPALRPGDVRPREVVPAASARGLVVRAANDRRPVERAEVFLVEPTRWTIEVADRVGLTGADGLVAGDTTALEAALTALRGPPTRSLLVRADGFRPVLLDAEGASTARSSALGRDDPIEILLPSADVVGGIVVDSFGRPVAGAQVIGANEFGDDLWSADRVAGPRVAQPLLRTGASAAGGFELRGVVEFPLSVVATAPGHALSWPPTVVSDASAKLRLVTRSLAVAAIRVVDAEDGRPVPVFSSTPVESPKELQFAGEDPRTALFGGDRPWNRRVDGVLWTLSEVSDQPTVVPPASDAYPIRMRFEALTYLPAEAVVEARLFARGDASVPQEVRLHRDPGIDFGRLSITVGPSVASDLRRNVELVLERQGVGDRGRLSIAVPTVGGAGTVDLPVGRYRATMVRDESIAIWTLPKDDPGLGADLVIERGATAAVHFEQPGVDVTVRVRAPSGEPALGATVELYRPGGRGLLGGVPLAYLRSAPRYEAARARFPAEPGVFRSRWATRELLVVAKHAVFGSSTAVVRPQRPGPTEIEVTLSPP